MDGSVAEPAPVEEPTLGVSAGTLKARSVRGAAATFVSQGLKFVLQFGSQVVLARMLNPSDFGLIAMVTPLISAVQLFSDLGLSQATVQRAQISQQELSSLFWINAGLGAALALLVVLGAPLVGLFYGDARTVDVTICLALLLVCAGLATQHAAVMNRNMQFMGLAVIDFASLAVAVVVGIASAYAGLGYWSLVAMQAANSLTVLALSWALCRWRPSAPRFDRGVLSLLRFGGHVTGFHFVNYLAYNVDSILIGRVSGEAALGLYNRAYRLMLQPLWQVTTPVARVAVPLLSRLQHQPEQYRRAYLQMLEVVLLVTAPGIMCAIVLSHDVIVTLLGRQWEATVPIFFWLGVGALFAPIGHSAFWLFISQDRARSQMIWGCVGSAILVASFVIGLPWGPVGVAASWAGFSVLLQGPMLWWAVTRTGPVRLRHLLSACSPIYLGAAVAAGALLAMRDLGHTGGLASLVIGLPLAYAATGLALAAFPAGRRVLHGMLQVRSSLRRGDASA